MSKGLRRLGVGTGLATGLSLLALSIGGIASVDADLQAAAEQRPGAEQVRVVHLRDCPHRGDRAF